ncbi:hypothetical protein SOCEGT47_036870 [Sorangium cellulosum]|uniref:Uncharacterized protein n=1 Tax=Sorangium cellulosum TaxID=56 RepID=A0A4P2Q2H1_SORCE|nr:hypothetical protein [Sorangium cellulosum]AUX23168.1 hypothetical protein SOCEGT47_036870 [Sorangium cellulosum]
MPVYELSVDAALVREAEAVVSLEGRAFPTLVMRWESRLFDQPWITTLVLDYAIALPPLVVSQSTFNEVRIAAFTGRAGTKFMYFGTEMSASVPRIAPEMENAISPPELYQEFRLDEHTCPIPYLKLIHVSPRIYGEGLQNYYSPPIKVERYDGVASPELISDFFPKVVANLEPVKGTTLVDPAQGFWTGARFLGATAIAILRQGRVVGLHRRTGKTDKDPLPPEVKRRDPRLDVRGDWVAVDVGAASTVVAVRGERGGAEFVRIGADAPVRVSADNENPTEVAFDALARTTKAWRDRVILPMTRWGDVLVGHAARDMRVRPGADLHERAAASLPALTLLRERTERGEPFRLRGKGDPEATEALKRPAPPIIDEEGIGAHDPFDPIELYAYYVGLHLNQRARGLYTRYAITMPTGWSPERRQSVLVAFRRGLFRSLPAGLCEYHDLEALSVVDAGPSAIVHAVQAFRTFGIQPRDGGVPFCAIDAGASEMGLAFGILRSAKADEVGRGLERMVEYIEPAAIPWLGGERLLHRLAYRVYVANQDAMRERRVPFERPPEEGALDGVDELFAPSPDARANTWALKELVRPLLERGSSAPVEEGITLFGLDGATSFVPLSIDRAALGGAIDAWFREGVELIRQHLDGAVAKIGRAPEPYEGLRVLLGGRVGMNQRFAELLASALPGGVQLHRFKEPDKANLGAPTVKMATALGALSLRLDRIGAALRAEKRDGFRYRVGRGRHGQLADVLDPSVDYDAWREMGACLKPEVEILFMAAQDEGEVAADDPRVRRAVCAFGRGAVGQRLYIRAVGPAQVEVSVGPPGGEPSPDAGCWTVHLESGAAEKTGG